MCMCVRECSVYGSKLLHVEDVKWLAVGTSATQMNEEIYTFSFACHRFNFGKWNIPFPIECGRIFGCVPSARCSFRLSGLSFQFRAQSNAFLMLGRAANNQAVAVAVAVTVTITTSNHFKFISILFGENYLPNMHVLHSLKCQQIHILCITFGGIGGEEYKSIRSPRCRCGLDFCCFFLSFFLSCCDDKRQLAISASILSNIKLCEHLTGEVSIQMPKTAPPSVPAFLVYHFHKIKTQLACSPNRIGCTKVAFQFRNQLEILGNIINLQSYFCRT